MRANLDWIKQRIAERPSTLIHADLRADNLLFGEVRLARRSRCARLATCDTEHGGH